MTTAEPATGDPGRGLQGPEASDALVAILAANGVDELFVMPGDAFPILEAIARRQEHGRAAPRVVPCLHETVALATAQGHFMVSGRPQACLFHVDVGLQMAGGMLHNAQRARAGVVILAGRTPMTLDGSMRGGRVIDVHWMQDRRDQAGGARDYVKWSYDLWRPEPLPQVMQRALQVARSEPCGPVFVSLLREMLMEPLAAETPDPRRFGPVRAPMPDPGGLDEVADLVARAESPVAIAGYVGRHAEGFRALGELAETAALPVYQARGPASIRTDHPMFAGNDPGERLAQADLVLLLDVDVPYVPAFQRLRPDATVVQIDLDALKADIPLWGFPVDVALAGSTSTGLPRLCELIAERVDARRVAERRERLSREHREWRVAQADAARAAAGRRPIAVEHVSRCVAELVDDGTIVVDDSTTAIATNVAHIPAREPGSYFQPMGTSMGWGSGAALGAKLAAPDRTVINLNADGNMISGVPEAALWAAARLDAPFLSVVFDNAQYAAIKLGLGFEYPDSAAMRSGAALDIPSPPDLVQIARACDAHAERVADPGEVAGALRRGLDAVQAGQAALVDVAVAGT